MSFMEYDILRCQRFDKNKMHAYWVVVTSVEGNSIKVAKSEFDKSFITGRILNPPVIGDELVQFGNAAPEGALKYRNRRSAIYLSADENGLPTIDVLQGICTKSFEGCMKLRIGGLDGITDTDFPEGIRDFGIYCNNGYFKGTIAGAGIFMLRADGSGYLAKGEISWDKKGNLKFGKNVTLSWENLSEDAKLNLKGKDADLVFPWLQEWVNNGTLIDGQKIVSSRIFSGKKNPDGSLTGVALGREVIEIGGVKKTGLFGVKDGKMTFSLDAETGDAQYSGEISIADGKIQLLKDGSGKLANGNIEWDIYGNVFVNVMAKKKPVVITPENIAYFTEVLAVDHDGVTWMTLNVYSIGDGFAITGNFMMNEQQEVYFYKNGVKVYLACSSLPYLPFREGSYHSLFLGRNITIQNDSNIRLAIVGYVYDDGQEHNPTSAIVEPGEIFTYKADDMPVYDDLYEEYIIRWLRRKVR